MINVWTRVLGEYKYCVGLNDRTLALRREGQGFNHRNGHYLGSSRMENTKSSLKKQKLVLSQVYHFNLNHTQAFSVFNGDIHNVNAEVA